MNPAKTGISRLLIASAIDADVYRRLLESPEETFDEFDLADEDRELLRHPDHRLLRVLGAALAEENASASAAASVATMAAPPAVAERRGASPECPRRAHRCRTCRWCSRWCPARSTTGENCSKFAYAAWVSPLPEGADPEALPPPPGTVLPGKPLPPLRAVVRVSAIQMQDAAGNPLVGLSASLLQSTNMSAPPPPEAAGNPAAIGRDLSAAEGSSRHRRRALRLRGCPLRQAHRASARAPSGGHIMSAPQMPCRPHAAHLHCRPGPADRDANHARGAGRLPPVGGNPVRWTPASPRARFWRRCARASRRCLTKATPAMRRAFRLITTWRRASLRRRWIIRR